MWLGGRNGLLIINKCPPTLDPTFLGFYKNEARNVKLNRAGITDDISGFLPDFVNLGPPYTVEVFLAQNNVLH